MLTRNYPMASSLKLVGDRYGLTSRQRLAISRSACSDEAQAIREGHCVPLQAIEKNELIIDGFNLIITIEAALAGGILLLGRDNCVRDLSSVHGSYRSVKETTEAIELAGRVLQVFGPASVIWLLDRPVSNSGRLAAKIAALAAEHGWPWKIEVVFNPDALMIASTTVAITSDGSILDHVAAWTNFKRFLVEHHLQDSWLLDLSCG
jgi:hypothetical protein